MLSCRQAVDRIAGLADRSLMPEQRADLLAHLDRCPACATLVRSYQKTTSLCRLLLSPKAPEALITRVLDATRRLGRGGG